MPRRTKPTRSPGRAAGKAARPRGRRPPLSRDTILEAALSVAQRDGVEGLSIRKLAGELRVSPMAVYHHVPNKQEILVGVINRVVGEADVTGHGVPRSRWQDWLRATFEGMYQALLEQPGVIPLLGNSLRVGPNALAVMDDVLGVLREAGIEGRDAVQGFHALISYTVGAASLRATTDQDTGGSPGADSVEDRPTPTELQHLADLSAELDGLVGSDRFADGFEVLLAGLAARSTPGR